MYSHCLFCAHSLGSNESIEHFPVGRRLAFDAAKGRLWVVCTQCMRWNLTPLEERWEAIEEAERLFRDARLRLSTGRIGLARMQDGTDLIRVGDPQRPELAAWRYGDQFSRRRVRTLAGTAAGIAVFGATSALLPGGGFVAGLLTGAAGVGAMGMLTGMMGNSQLFKDRFVRDNDGAFLRLTPNEIGSVRLAPASDGFMLRVPYNDRRERLDARWTDWINKGAVAEATLTGDAALDAARKILPLVNGSGARKSHVADAVTLVADWGDARHGFTSAASHVREWAAKQSFGDTGALPFLPRPVRLALEMISHEEQERRALEGELAQLEEAWKEAEQIAAISDDLLLPSGITGALERLRTKLRSH